MDHREALRESDIFVVRVFGGSGAAFNGLVHHVRTGERVPFQGLESLGEAIARMASRPGDDTERTRGR